MRYREFKIVNEQDIHNPNVNMKDVFETIDMIQEMGLGLRWTDSDDGIVILGALGDPKFNKKIRSMYSEFNTTDNPSADSRPDFELSTMSNTPGPLGVYNPNTGRISISSKQNIKSAKATLAHEAAHRGFAIIDKISELRRLAHPDLNGIWEGGWGEKDYKKFPNPNDEQVNPEHCMIYSVLGIGHREYLRIFLEGIMKISSEAREYFNSSEFNNREFYADADSEYPLQGLEKLRAYWAELYDTTSRNVRNYLNSRLSSPRPVSRDDKNQNRGTSYGRVRMPQDDTPVPQRDNNPDPTPVSTPRRRQPRGGDTVTGIDDINDILTGKR